MHDMGNEIVSQANQGVSEDERDELWLKRLARSFEPNTIMNSCYSKIEIFYIVLRSDLD